MTNKDPKQNQRRQNTLLVRGGTKRSNHKETSEAIFLTSGFVYDSAEEAEARFKGELPGYLYGRYANPTNTMLEERLAALDGAQVCRLAASGMAAVQAALLASVRAGDHIVAGKALFSSCRYIIETLLPRYGVEFTLVEGANTKAWADAVKPNTKAFFLESPANPTLEISDIKSIADIAHKAGARLIVDNAFATPLLQKPIELGADVIVYSLTKHCDGQGRVLAGAILGDEKWVTEELDPILRHTGPAMSPFVAWVVLKGMETLSLRVDRMCDNAQKIADLIGSHEAVNYVRYPTRKDHPQHELAMSQMKNGGTIVAFELKGGKDGAYKFLNALEIVDISNNLGDAKSLATHPATTTHKLFEADVQAELGVTQGLIRLSVGIEDIDDLLEDVKQALDKAK
ncbi:MAG: O-succinylhomoserine sulfhydrylase [Caulobacterales bacterium]|nr:O-succinylhomoserine sulfhydrylase [Caulobacterales bacterium]MCA0373825.1 O-succinylhomoserine sulfhydrylase [Pseudomonadota bacterium]